MTKTVLNIDGMMCPMCETHINECIRNNFKVKKVSSSHTKNETVIISESAFQESDLKQAVEKTGYKILSVKSEPYEKKGLFSFLSK